MPAVAEEEPDDTTSSETQEQYHRRKSQCKFNCMHTCCAYNMQLQLYTFIMLVDIIIIGVGMALMPAEHNTFSKPPK